MRVALFNAYRSLDLSTHRMLPSKCHYRTGHHCNELPVRASDVTTVKTYGFAQLNRFRRCPDLIFPERTKEIDTEVNACEGLILPKRRRVRRSDSGIGDIT